MNSFLKTRRWIIIYVIITLCGCSLEYGGVKKQQLETDRSIYYPLAVFSSNKIPQVSGEVYTGDIQRGMSGKCLVGAVVFTFGLLAPLCTPLLIVDGVAATEINERKEELALKIESLIPRMEQLADQKMLRTQTMKHLFEKNINAHEVTEDSVPFESVERSLFLQKRGFPMGLELSLLLLEYSEHKETFCLTMQIQGRTIRTNDNQQIAIEKAQSYRCKPFKEWLIDEELEIETLNMYSALSKTILNQILFIYQSSEDDTISLSAITPKLTIPEKWNENCDWVEEDCYNKLMGETWRGNPERMRNLLPLSTLPFTEVEEIQNFKWTPLKGPIITNVRYDFKIYQGYQRVGAVTSGISDDYPAFQYVAAGEVIYSHENILEASHEADILLEPCSWYFWTVRANFQLNGNSRITEWSMFTNPVHKKKSYFPIHTPAAENDSECWNQKVDWGSL